MNKSLTLTVRMPVDLKKRLERDAKYQGVSLNQLTNYMLTIQLTQLEMVSSLDKKMIGKSIPKLKEKVMTILDKIPERNVPAWDSLE